MSDQQLSDIATLLSYCRREKAWAGPRREIEAIEARYAQAIRELLERKMIDAGHVREGSGWTLRT